MNATITVAAKDLRMLPSTADHTSDTRAEPCDCQGMIAAFESVPGPRRKRAASDDDIVECLDAGTPETEPATMVQRIPV